MLEHSPDGPPRPAAAPRHLRRRRLHSEIPDTLLAPDVEPVSFAPGPGGPPRPVSGPASDAELLDREAQHQRKRRIALLAVLFVAVVVPALVLVLLLG
jgi:hypothetical protein